MITVYVWWFGAQLATVTLMLLTGQQELVLRRKPEYVGRHRKGAVENPFNWQADFETRLAVNLAAVVAEAEAEKAAKAALVAAVKEPTAEMPVPDLDSTVELYAHKGGVGRYAHLRTDELDAKAQRDQALADMGLILRHPWSTPLVDDDWDQAVMLTEVGR